VPAGLLDVDARHRGPVPDCGWSVGDDRVPLVLLPAAGDGERLLRLDYLTGASGVLHLTVGGVEQAVEYPAGVGSMWFVVTGRSGPVEAWRTGTPDGVCVAAVERGVPVPGL